MRKELYETVYKYIKSKSLLGELLDFNDLIMIGRTISVDQGLLDYAVNFKECVFKNDLGRYLFRDKTVYLNMDEFLDVNEQSDPLISNLHLLVNLLHELHHARQFKILHDFHERKFSDYSTVDQLEYILLSISLRKLSNFPNAEDDLEKFNKYFGSMNNNFRCFDDVYCEYYTYNPSERFAELSALQDTLQLIKKYETDNDIRNKLVYHFNGLLLKNELRGYYPGKNEVYSPTETFIDCMNVEDSIKNIWNHINYYNKSKYVEDHWYYGLEVPMEEYKLKKALLDDNYDYKKHR